MLRALITAGDILLAIEMGPVGLVFVSHINTLPQAWSIQITQSKLVIV